jgi:hypothetical protein
MGGTMKTTLTGLIVTLLGAFLGTACDKLAQDTQLADIKGYEYPGAASLTANDDGTSTLVWPSAPVGAGANYQVFVRKGDDAFKWDTPSKVLTQNTMQTEDLRFESKTCFAVRVFSAAFSSDKNVKEVCTPGTGFVFAGLESLERADSGRWVLKWSKVPTSRVSYQILEGDASGTGSLNEKPLREVNETQAEVGPFAIGEVKCFAVRFVVVNKPNLDTNTVQKCTDANRIQGFVGIDKLESRATGKAILSWSAAVHPDIIGYVIYKGTDFKETVTTVNLKQLSNLTLSDLTPGERVTFGVRAISKDGSEDKNTRTMSVQVLDLRPLAFAGITNAAVAGKHEAQANWSAVAGAKEYRIYVASGELGTSPAFDWSKPTLVVQSTQGTSARLPNLGDEMRHVIAVRSVSQFDVEDSNTANIVLDFPDQGAPVFAGIKSATLVNGKVELVWNKAEGQVTKYRIYRAKGSAAALDLSTTNVPFRR